MSKRRTRLPIDHLLFRRRYAAHRSLAVSIARRGAESRLALLALEAPERCWATSKRLDAAFITHDLSPQVQNRSISNLAPVLDDDEIAAERFSPRGDV